jgi:hypothetical protein
MSAKADGKEYFTATDAFLNQGTLSFAIGFNQRRT